jgi:hypothetical protein
MLEVYKRSMFILFLKNLIKCRGRELEIVRSKSFEFSTKGKIRRIDARSEGSFKPNFMELISLSNGKAVVKVLRSSYLSKRLEISLALINNSSILLFEPTKVRD